LHFVFLPAIKMSIYTTVCCWLVSKVVLQIFIENKMLFRKLSRHLINVVFLFSPVKIAKIKSRNIASKKSRNLNSLRAKLSIRMRYIFCGENPVGHTREREFFVCSDVILVLQLTGPQDVWLPVIWMKSHVIANKELVGIAGYKICSVLRINTQNRCTQKNES
jgi:hypothetical protein